MDCQSSSMISLASLWVYIMTVVRGESHADQKRRARLHAEQTIDNLQARESMLEGELRTLAMTARQAKVADARNTLRSILMSSKATRQQLVATSKKRCALQNHLETLKSSELNEQVLSSVKETSDVLKKMGLDKSLADMDEVVQDLQEAHSDVASLQETLSESFTGSGAGDELDIDTELELLLSDDCGKAATLIVAKDRPLKPSLVADPAHKDSMECTDKNKNESTIADTDNATSAPGAVQMETAAGAIPIAAEAAPARHNVLSTITE